MNPNSGQPIQDPLTPTTPSPQDSSTANQQIQQEEQGLGDIFANDILEQKSQVSAIQEPATGETSPVIEPRNEPQVQIQTPQINTDPISSQFSQSQFSQETPIATPITESLQQTPIAQQPVAPQIQTPQINTDPVVTIAQQPVAPQVPINNEPTPQPLVQPQVTQESTL